MSSNDGSVMDENGNTPDWIEVMNVSNHVVDLEGYALAKSEKSANVFTFPSVKLAPNECVVVFADAMPAGGEETRELHAPFRLSSKGNSLMLFSSSGTAIDAVNYPALATDCVYERVDRRNWAVADVGTPGMPNDTANDAPTGNLGVEITEIVASNTMFACDEEGMMWDYIEVHNTTGESKDLSGWYLSDDPTRPTRWSFPEGFVLATGEYRIVYAAGGASREGTQTPYASFGLSTEGETVLLSNERGILADSVTFDLLHENKAWSKAADGTWSETTPTPNEANG
jgi:Intermediate filament tail domain.